MNKKKGISRKIKFLSVISILLVLLILAVGCKKTEGNNKETTAPTDSASSASPDDNSGASPDDDSGASPDDESGAIISLKNLDGKSVSLEDYKGKVVVLNFWASWCPPCKAEMPELADLDDEFKKDDKVVFLAVNLTDGQRETEKKARDYIEKNGFKFNVLLDTNGDLADEFDVGPIPHTAIIDKEGKLSDTIIGSTTKDKVMSKVDKVL